MTRFVLAGLWAGCVPAPGLSPFDPNGDWDRDGVTENEGDCDDTDASIGPAAVDVCNGVDDDCDGGVDPTAPAWYVDKDGDGYGVGDPVVGCEPPSEGYTAVAGDCSDDLGQVYPEAPDPCGNGVDDDCDDVEKTCFWSGEHPARAADRSGAGTGAIVSSGSLLADGASPLVYSLAGTRVQLRGLDPAFAVDLLAPGAEDFVYGRATAVIGDFDGDGQDDVAAGFADRMVDSDVRGLVALLRGPFEPRVGEVLDVQGVDGAGLLRGKADDREGAGIALAVLPGDPGVGDRLLVGAPSDRGGAGVVYLLQPQAGLFEVDTTLEEVAEVAFEGEFPYDDNLGVTVGGVGDVDADGIDDMAFGTLGSASDPLEVFVVLGGERWASVEAIEDVAIANFTTSIDGANLGSSGPAIVDAGDVDGDGHDELVLSDGGGDASGGGVFVIFNVHEATARMDEAASIQLLGPFGFGRSVSAAGDVDGDDYPDLLIGSWLEDVEVDLAAGAMWVCPAWALPYGSTAEVNVERGFLRFTGEAYENLGAGVLALGDLDGNGYDEYAASGNLGTYLFYNGAD